MWGWLQESRLVDTGSQILTYLDLLEIRYITSEYQNSGVTGVPDKGYSLNTSRYYSFGQLCNFFILRRERQSSKTKHFFKSNLFLFTAFWRRFRVKSSVSVVSAQNSTNEIINTFLFFFVVQSFVSCVCHECEHGRAHLWGL